GEGVWSIDTTTGAVTFTPEAGFTSDPTPVTYTVADNEGNRTAPATITLTFTPEPPVAGDDQVSNVQTGQQVTLNVLGNDQDPDGSLEPTSVVITSPPTGATLSSDGKTLTVPGEGIWSVDTSTGAITFMPASGFTNDPTPITYTVADNDGNVSNAGTVAIDYTARPPLAGNDQISGATTGQPVVVATLSNDTDP
ncbi:MAG: hypothetical protein AAFR04_16415, partial [Pseudomonadota bacterium]